MTHMRMEVTKVLKSKQALSIESLLPDQAGVAYGSPKQLVVGYKTVRGVFRGYSVAWEDVLKLRKHALEKTRDAYCPWCGALLDGYDVRDRIDGTKVWRMVCGRCGAMAPAAGSIEAADVVARQSCG